MKIALVLIITIGIFMIMIPSAYAENIPNWVKNTAGWWSTDVISETEFVNAIEFLVNEGIIDVSGSNNNETNTGGVPNWVKNTAGWWSTDVISETEFVNAIEFLVNEGIIEIDNENSIKDDLLQTREKIILTIWDDVQLPPNLPDKIEKKIDDEIFEKIPYNKQTDSYTVTMKHDVYSKIFLLHPIIQNNELIILNNGHGGRIHDPTDLYSEINTVRFFLNKGYSVLIVSLPLEGINNRPIVMPSDNLELNELMKMEYDEIVDEGKFKLEHHLHFEFLKNNDFNPMSYFFEPINSTLNSIDDEYDFDKYHMIGISGGGWVSAVYSAIDERISTTHSIAGMVPIEYLIEEDRGHWEIEELGKIIDYTDVYTLSTLNERKFLQFFNSNDPCCFGKGQDLSFSEIVLENAEKLENSSYNLFTINNYFHKINPEIMKVIFVHLTDGNENYFNESETRYSNNDFSFSTITERVFSTDLINSDFSQSELSNIDFSKSNLSNSVFFYGQLNNVDFNDSDLSNSNLSYTRVLYSNFENVDLTNSDFKSAVIINSNFQNSILDGTNFSFVICYTCDFKNTDMNSVKIPKIKTIQYYPRFPASDFTGVDFRSWDGKRIDFSAVNIANLMPHGPYRGIDSMEGSVKYSSTTYNYGDRGAILSESNFSDMNLQKMIFSRGMIKVSPDGITSCIDSSYKLTNFPDNDEINNSYSCWNSVFDYTIAVKLDSANLSNSNLSGNQLGVVYMPNTDFSNSILIETVLKGSIMIDSNFTNANLEGANLEGANLEGANFTNANLEGANFTNAIVIDVNFTNANLEGANFTNANLEGANLNCINHLICN